MDRRHFLQHSVAAVAGAALGVRRLFAETVAPVSRVVAVHGTDIPGMLSRGVEALGGWPAFIRAGKPATLKPNIAWASTPAQAANTNPVLVEACIRACQQAGANSVVLPENPCSPARNSFEMSGMSAVAKRTGAQLYALESDADFVNIPVPRGTVLRQVEVARDVLQTGCLINMPVAKTHGGAGLTLSMKNWLGSVRDRGFFHREGLNECIVDCNTVIRANLIIVDALRIMTTNGPRGPGRLEAKDQLVFGTDPVAVDAYCATLFDREPFDIAHIRLAHERNLGCGDLSRVAVDHLRA